MITFVVHGVRNTTSCTNMLNQIAVELQGMVLYLPRLYHISHGKSREIFALLKNIFGKQKMCIGKYFYDCGKNID